MRQTRSDLRKRGDRAVGAYPDRGEAANRWECCGHRSRLALARDEREVPGPDRRWAFEPKLDGWRAVVFTATGVMQPRRDNDLAGRFPEIVTAARTIGDLVVDGEVVALREGRLEFGALTSSRLLTGFRMDAGAVDATLARWWLPPGLSPRHRGFPSSVRGVWCWVVEVGADGGAVVAGVDPDQVGEQVDGQQSTSAELVGRDR